MYVNFCYNATLSTGAIMELEKIQKKGLFKAQLYLEKHDIFIGMATISRVDKPRECDIPNQEKFIKLLQQKHPGLQIAKLSIEFVRTETPAA